MSGRPSITAPNGRRYHGRHPDGIPQVGEGPYISELACLVDGLCEVVLPVGRADVASKAAVFEVEPARSWRIGARQVLGYAAQTGWPPALALFGSANYTRIFRFLRQEIPAITLWGWQGRWAAITTAEHATVLGKATTVAPPEVPDLPQVDWIDQVKTEHPYLDHKIALAMAESRRKAATARRAMKLVMAS